MPGASSGFRISLAARQREIESISRCFAASSMRFPCRFVGCPLHLRPQFLADPRALSGRNGAADTNSAGCRGWLHAHTASPLSARKLSEVCPPPTQAPSGGQTALRPDKPGGGEPDVL